MKARQLLDEALPALHAALRVDGADGLRTQAQIFDEQGAPHLAWAARVMGAAASARGDLLPALGVEAPAGAMFRYLAAWSVYWTPGSPALPDLDRIDQGDLPPDWAANLHYLAGRGPSEPPNRVPAASPFLPGRDLPTVEAVIAGRTARLIVDTGAPTSVVAQAFANRAGLRSVAPGRRVQDGAGAFAEIVPVRARVELSGARWEAAPLDVVPLSQALDVDGLLSPQHLLNGASILFDGVRRELLAGVPAPEAAERECALTWLEGQPFVRAEFRGGRRAWMLLDSGAGACLAGPDLAADLGIAAGDATRSATAFSTVRVRAGGEAELRLGDEGFEPVSLLVKNPPGDSNSVFPNLTEGYIGANWFGGRQVWISENRRCLRFSARGETAR